MAVENFLISLVNYFACIDLLRCREFTLIREVFSHAEKKRLETVYLSFILGMLRNMTPQSSLQVSLLVSKLQVVS